MNNLELNNKTYDRLKLAVQVILPALLTCYTTIAVALGLPATEVVTIIAGAVITCLGTILGISSKNYEKNKMDNNA